MELEIFGQTVPLSKKAYDSLLVEMRNSAKVPEATKGKSEIQLLAMLAVEKHTQNRVFVIERVYIKYKKARERREKVELLTD